MPSTPESLRIHLHALCWNEARMLPYFFRHYDSIVDRYFIYDNGSTDGSIELLERHPRVTLESFAFQSSFVEEAAIHYNHCWKRSRGEADWVFVVNVDEHLYHPHLRDYLATCTSRGVTVVVPEGYQMVANEFPACDRPLVESVQYGARDAIWDKPQFFDPTRIAEINFSPGRHAVSPVGLVVYPEEVSTKLLHFKYLGGDYLVERHGELGARLTQAEYAKGWAYQYTWTRDKNLEELERTRRAAVRVV